MPIKRSTRLKKTQDTTSEDDINNSSSERMTVVTEVVEVEGEPAAETVTETPQGTITESAGIGELETAPKEEVEYGKTKEVVEELFKPSGSSVMPEISSARNKKSISLGFWAMLVIISALITGGIILFISRGPSSGVFPGASLQPTPTSAPSPTPQLVKREDLTIAVINGGGVAGAGGKMKTLLEEKGYKVISVGNAKDYDYEETEIQVKANKESYLSLLQADLKENYLIGSVSASLPEDSSSDATVIVGKQ